MMPISVEEQVKDVLVNNAEQVGTPDRGGFRLCWEEWDQSMDL